MYSISMNDHVSAPSLFKFTFLFIFFLRLALFTHLTCSAVSDSDSLPNNLVIILKHFVCVCSRTHAAYMKG